MGGSRPCYYLLPVLGCGIALIYIFCLATVFVGINITGKGGDNRTATFTNPVELLEDPIIDEVSISCLQILIFIGWQLTQEDLTPTPGLQRNSCQIRVPWWHFVLGILLMIKVLDLVIPCRVRMTMFIHHSVILFFSVVMAAVVTSVGLSVTQYFYQFWQVREN